MVLITKSKNDSNLSCCSSSDVEYEIFRCKLSVCFCLFLMFFCLFSNIAAAKRRKHFTDNYPAAYQFLAKDAVVIQEGYPGSVRPNGYFGPNAVQLRGGGKDVLRIVLKNIEPGEYYIGAYGRISHGAPKVSLSQTARCYHMAVDGKPVALRKVAPDPYIRHQGAGWRIVNGTVLTEKPVKVNDRSAVDVKINASGHSLIKLFLFRKEEDIKQIIPIAAAANKKRQVGLAARHRKTVQKKNIKAEKAKPITNKPLKVDVTPKSRVQYNLSQQDTQKPLRIPCKDDTSGRQPFALADGWKYLIDNERNVLKHPVPPAGEWKSITLPTAWHNRRCKVKGDGVYYRLRFQLPEDINLADKSVLLKFNFVRAISDLYLDGKKIGSSIANPMELLAEVSTLVQPGKIHELLLVANQGRRAMGDFNVISGGSTYSKFGIHVVPELIVCGKAYADWTFIRPSYRTKTLRVDTHVLNSSVETVDIQVRHRIMDKGKELFSFISPKTTVPAGKTLPAVASHAWPKTARIWWLHDPYTYELQSEILVDGNVSDQVAPIKFGFREFWLKGTDYILNGKKLFLWTWAKNANFWRLHHRERAFLGFVKKGGVDEKYRGAVMIPEFDVGVRRGKTWGDPVFAKHYKAHVQGWAKKLCNIPEVMIYSIENEVLHCGEHSNYRKLPELLSDVGKALAEVDPTRPYMYNGDGDLLGDKSVPIINLHYPRNIGLGRLLPDDIHWLDGTGSFRIDSNIGGVTWERKRPMFMGEVWWLDTVGAPWALSTHFGEAVYDRFVYRLPHWAKTATYYVNHYRLNGVNAMNHWNVPCLKWNPVDLVDETFRFIYPCGNIKRQFRLVNETQVDKELVVTWCLQTKGGKTIKENKLTTNVAGGENTVVTLPITLPECDIPTEYILKTTILDGETPANEKSWTFVAVPPVGKPLAGLSLFVIERNDDLAKTLTELGAKVKSISSELLLPKEGVLIIAGGASQGINPRHLEAFVAGGGRLLYLHNANRPPWTPLPLEWSRQEANFTFIRTPNHPAMKVFTDTMLALWNPKYRVARQIPRKPLNGRFLPLLESGSASGLHFSPLLEMPQKNGTCIVSQLLLMEKIKSEPIASHVLAALVKYLNNYRPAKKIRVASILSKRDQKVLTNVIGVEATDIVGSQHSLDEFDLLILDSQCYDGKIKPIVDFVKQGGTLILRSLTAESKKRFSELLPTSLRVVDSSYPQTVRIGTPPLLDGINQEDLLWMWRSMRENSPMKNDARIVTHELMGLSPEGKDWQALTRNFFNDGKCRGHNSKKGERWSDGTAIAQGRIGKGLVILDQVNWDDGLLYMEKKLKRIAATMLGNLGAEIKPAVEKVTWKYQPIALKPNRSFKEWMNWGENNLQRFPTGKVLMQGVPFVIPENGKQVIMLRAEDQMAHLPAVVRNIPVNAKADELCFLQTCTYGFDFEVRKPVMTYLLTYEDGSKIKRTVAYGIHVFDWQRPPAILDSTTAVVWDKGTPEHEHAYVYLMRIRNPKPDKRIKSLSVISGKCRAVPVLLGLTLALKETGKNKSPKAVARQNRGLWRVKEDKVREERKYGQWRVIGSFDNPQSQTDPVGTGFFVSYPPEKDINFTGSYAGKQGAIRWQKVKVFENLKRAKNSNHAHIDFNLLYLEANAWAVVYAYTRVYSPEKQSAILNFGSDDGAKVWLNDKEVISIHTSRGASVRQHAVPVTLNKGWNNLLVKVEQMGGGWELYCRFDNTDNIPLTNLKFDSDAKE